MLRSVSHCLRIAKARSAENEIARGNSTIFQRESMHMITCMPVEFGRRSDRRRRRIVVARNAAAAVAARRCAVALRPRAARASACGAARRPAALARFVFVFFCVLCFFVDCCCCDTIAYQASRSMRGTAARWRRDTCAARVARAATWHLSNRTPTVRCETSSTSMLLLLLRIFQRFFLVVDRAGVDSSMLDDLGNALLFSVVKRDFIYVV